MATITTTSRNEVLATLLAEQAEALKFLLMDKQDDARSAYADGHQEWLHTPELRAYADNLSNLYLEAQRLAERLARVVEQDRRYE